MAFMEKNDTPPKYWRKASSLKRVHIHAFEAWDGSNNYFSAHITLNDKYYITMRYQYGHERMFIEQAERLLIKEGWTTHRIDDWEILKTGKMLVQTIKQKDMKTKEVKRLGTNGI